MPTPQSDEGWPVPLRAPSPGSKGLGCTGSSARGWVALALVPTKCTGSLASPGARDRLTAAIEFVIVFLFFFGFGVFSLSPGHVIQLHES